VRNHGWASHPWHLARTHPIRRGRARRRVHPRPTILIALERLRRFKRRHQEQAARALDRLSAAVEKGGNVFAELLTTVEHCSLGQITGRLHELVGRYRPSV